MNTFLKALIQELWDLAQTGEQALAKQWSAVATAAIKAGMDLPALISAIGSAGADLQALLANPAADADLLGFVVGLVTTQTKAELLIVDSVDLTLSLVACEPKLVKLVTDIQAPAPAAA